ncbi:MAG: enoyl-CoA hydratase/carnithine racemase [Halioglobus sp.]|jgi:enoyl-CoA hydratase/carnithine racemase
MNDLLQYETVFAERKADGVVLITLNRPEHGNGVVPQLARDLTHLLAAIEEDNSLRVMILTGAGKQFCAGADLHAFQTYLEDDLSATEEPYNARLLFPITQKIVQCRLPVIAAINGGATAGGLDLALACDIRLAAQRAKMGETYIKLGLNLGNGGSYFLPRLVGSGVAAELALTGEVIDASRALALGLVNRVLPDDSLISEAIDLAQKIARHPRLAIEATKQQLRNSWHMDLNSSMNASFWSVAALTHTRDLKEGVDAAVEKRDPQYNTGDLNEGD